MSPPPGWYPDPAGPGARYWDGGRWTEDTQAAEPIGQGSAPIAQGPTPVGPSAGGSLAPPNPQATPTGIGQPAPRPSGGQVGRPAGATATSPLNLAGFVDQLKRLDPVTLAVVGFAVFLLSTVLSWLNVRGTGAQGEASDSFSAWSSEAPWRFRGFSVDFALQEVANNRNPTGGTDVILLLPLAIAAVVLLVVAAQGKPVRYATEAAAAVGVLLVLLLILEVVHIGSWYDDAQQALTAAAPGATISGSPGFGLWLGLVAAAVIAFAAVRAVLAARSRLAAPSCNER